MAFAAATRIPMPETTIELLTVVTTVGAVSVLIGAPECGVEVPTMNVDSSTPYRTSAASMILCAPDQTIWYYPLEMSVEVKVPVT